MIPFNNKKHSDITVVVSSGAITGTKDEGAGATSSAAAGSEVDEKTFFLHKFPLISKSHYFHDHIPETAAAQGPIEMRLADFPGGPRAFETVARYCYNMDIEVTVEDVALTYCAAKYLRIPDLEKSTEKFMAEVVLPDPRRSAKVLQVATGLENMTDDMMEGLIGQSINAIAARFEAPLAELNALPADCFACVIRTAHQMETDKRRLEAAVVAYLDSRIKEDAVQLSVDEFVDVVSSSGRMEAMRHCEAIYAFLEVMLKTYTGDEEAEQLCRALHDQGFWVCLPHVVIERAYGDHNIPDRYCTVALMAENRHLLKVNEQLTAQVEQLTDAITSSAGASAGVGGMASMGASGKAAAGATEGGAGM